MASPTPSNRRIDLHTQSLGGRTNFDCAHDCAVSMEFNGCDKWAAWFSSCPDSVLLESLSTQRVAEINEHFEAISGFSRDELRGSSLEDLFILTDPQLWHSFRNELSQFGALRDRAFELRTKEGQIRNVQASMQILTIAGEAYNLAVIRDLTDLRKNEIDLLSISGALEAAVEGIAFIDINGRYTRVNPAYAAMLGSTPECVTGGSWRDSVHPEDLGEMYAAHAQMLEGGKAQIEVRGIRKDGSTFDKQVTLVRIVDQEGAYAGHYRCTTDITARKARERVVSTSESRLKTIWYSVPESVVVVDRSLQVTDMNPAGLRMLGFSDVQSIKGRAVFDFIDSLSRDRISAALDQVFDGEPVAVEFEMLGSQGRRLLAESEIAPLISFNGGIDEILIISRDVTMKRYSEAALRRTEERYRDLTENANDVIYTIDAEGRFTSLNRAAESLLGYKRSELLNRPVLSLVCPQSLEAAQKMVLAHQSGETSVSVERYFVIAKDGREILLEVSSRSVYEQLQFCGIQGIARDITERERNRQQMAATQRLEALGRLSAGVAHDFNNVLAIIQACAELQEGSFENPEQVVRLSSQIKQAVTKAAGITSQLLTFSRQKKTEPYKLLVNNVVENMSGLLERLLGKNVNLTLKLADELPEIFVDPTQLELVILNLVVNAKDAIKDRGTVLIETEKVFLDDSYVNHDCAVGPGWYVKLLVRDTGCGIDRETQKHIFEPFFTTKKDKGTGLGLATLYGIVKEAGGYVWVYSEVGVGTTFKIYLPVCEKRELSPVPSPEDKPSGTVLVVDDDDDIRKAIVTALEARGFKVVEAQSGKQALNILDTSENSIKVLVSDFTMPEMDGGQLSRLALQRFPGLKIKLMSGYGGNVEAGELHDAVSIIEKPFSIESLVRELQMLLKA